MTIPYTFASLPGPIPLSELDANFIGVNTYNQGSTGSVTRTIQNKLQESISVKDFGAVGDGVTDDTSAIQLAANAASGKVLLFPPGNYVVNNGFTLTGDNSVVWGYGAVLTYNATSFSYNHCIRIFGNDIGVYGIKIKSPSGLVRNQTGFGISAGDVSTQTIGLIIQDCVLDSIASAGIWVSNVKQCKVLANTSKDCLADGIHFSDGCFDISCIDNILINNGDDSIAIVNDTVGTPLVGYVTIVGNVIDSGTNGHGIALIGAIGGLVSSNFITNTVNPAIGTYFFVDSGNVTSDLLIEGNLISNCGTGGITFGGAGINLQQTGTVTIRGNQISNITYDAAKICGAIRVISGTEIAIADNHFFNLACDGIIVTSASSNLVIQGNVSGYCARIPVLVSGSVTRCVVSGNAFNDTAGSYDISVNLPSSPVYVMGNKFSKPVNVIANNTAIDLCETETFSSTISAQAGTITSASGTICYQRRGAMLLVSMTVSIITNGTGAGSIIASLPFAVTLGVLTGRENSLTGVSLTGMASGSTVIIRKYDNGYPGANGSSMTLSGILQIV